MATDLARFLVRSALDDEFRRLAEEHPDEAMEGYDLGDQARELLRRRDPEVLALLGQALRETLPVPAEPVAPDPPQQGAQALPELTLLVRIQPWATPLPDGQLQLSWTASMEPFEPPDVAPVPGGSSALEPAEGHPGRIERARAAAESVLAASPADRYQRVLDLVEALAEPQS